MSGAASCSHFLFIRAMLSHFVGSPLTNCAAERNPLSTDGNAMKEGEREREIEGAAREPQRKSGM